MVEKKQKKTRNLKSKTYTLLVRVEENPQEVSYYLM